MQSGESKRTLYSRFLEFPNITYEDFINYPEHLRQELIKKNKILLNDSYNRTMSYMKGDRWDKPETYVLQMRKAPDGYLIVHGLAANLAAILEVPVNEAELKFAIEFYKRSNIPFFNLPMWEKVVYEHNGFLPISIDALPEGTAILAGDPVLRVTGPGELAAHFESVFHHLFYDTLVATTAHEISRKIGESRFVEVGRRSVPNEQTHLQASAAMFVGGGITLTSNDAAVAVYPQLKDSGTMGHRFVQHYKNEDEAFEVAVAQTGDDFLSVLLVDLVDSLEGIEKALALKVKYRNTSKRIWLRLDSGDVASQAIYALKRFKELGFTDPERDKIIVEDLDNVDEMYEIDQSARKAGMSAQKYIVYGAGGLLVNKNKERSQASTGFKLSEVDGKPRMKFSDNESKESLPGIPTLVMLNQERMIAQVGEFPDAEDMFVPIYRPGKLKLIEDQEVSRAQVQNTFKQIQYRLGKRTQLSPKTKEMVADLRNYYNKQY